MKKSPPQVLNNNKIFFNTLVSQLYKVIELNSYFSRKYIASIWRYNQLYSQVLITTVTISYSLK